MWQLKVSNRCYPALQSYTQWDAQAFECVTPQNGGAYTVPDPLNWVMYDFLYHIYDINEQWGLDWSSYYVNCYKEAELAQFTGKRPAHLECSPFMQPSIQLLVEALTGAFSYNRVPTHEKGCINLQYNGTGTPPGAELAPSSGGSSFTGIFTPVYAYQTDIPTGATVPSGTERGGFRLSELLATGEYVRSGTVWSRGPYAIGYSTRYVRVSDISISSDYLGSSYTDPDKKETGRITFSFDWHVEDRSGTKYVIIDKHITMVVDHVVLTGALNSNVIGELPSDAVLGNVIRKVTTTASPTGLLISSNQTASYRAAVQAAHGTTSVRSSDLTCIPFVTVNTLPLASWAERNWAESAPELFTGHVTALNLPGTSGQSVTHVGELGKLLDYYQENTWCLINSAYYAQVDAINNGLDKPLGLNAIESLADLSLSPIWDVVDIALDLWGSIKDMDMAGAILGLVDFLTTTQLIHQYAVKPTTKEVSTILERIKKFSPNGLGITALRGAHQGVFPSISSDYIEARAKIVAKPKLEAAALTLFQLDRMGVLPTAGRLWAAVPLSFIVDMLTRVGSSMEAFESGFRLRNMFEVQYVVYSVKITRDVPDYGELDATLYHRWVQPNMLIIARCNKNWDFLAQPLRPDFATLGSLFYQLAF